MRHFAAYLMCVLGGNASPTPHDVRRVLSSVGVDTDDAQLTCMFESLATAVHSPADLDALLLRGMEKLCVVRPGAAAAAAPVTDTDSLLTGDNCSCGDDDGIAPVDFFGSGEAVPCRRVSCTVM